MSQTHASGVPESAEFDLTIIVICYNSGRLIVDNLAAVVNSSRWQTRIIDNNSPDDSASLLLAHFRPEQVLALPRNEGYGRGANVVLHQLQTRYALLLNPDIVVNEVQVAEFFDASTRLETPAAIVAPATSAAQYQHRGRLPRHNVLGAAMLFDREQMTDIGWFDEQLFLYYEEKDLCRRVMDAGGAIYLDTDHHFVHHKGTSSGESEQIAYLKHWHVGWSSCHYRHKHGLGRGRHHPLAYLIKYVAKAVTYRNPRERLKYRARSAGVIAWLRGLGAFDETGRPRATPVPP